VDFDPLTPTALLSALALAREHGGAAAALRHIGVGLDDVERFEGLPEEFGRLLAGTTPGEALSEALALGLLAGQVAPRPRPRRSLDPSSFLMDHDLLVQRAEGQSILRLPWFEEDLFVGRQLADISEMPAPVRMLCVANYRAGLAGERGRFRFTSYGHAYQVESVPVRGDDGRVKAVLGIATPAPPPAGRLRAAEAFDRAAERLERSAELADHHADLYRATSDAESESREREAAAKARRAAQRARAAAHRHRSESRGPFP
jgi:hypothetical protein